MFTETLLLQVGRLMFCLLVTAITRSQADLQFSMDRTTDSIYCGHLRCLANYNEFDTRVLSIAELSIFDVIQANLKVKLASVSMFDSNLFVEPSKVNVLNLTGSVSRYHGDLTLSLRDVTDCLYGTFTCELDFLNRDIIAEVISDSLTPDLPVVENGTCAMLGSQLSKMEDQIKTHSVSVEAELGQIKTHSVSVEADLVQIKTHSVSVEAELGQIKAHSVSVDAELGQIKTHSVSVEAELGQIKTHSVSVEAELGQIKTHSVSIEAELAQIKTQNRDMAVNLDIILDQLARLETSFNSSHDDLKVTCRRWMSYSRPRERFLLWGTVPALCDTDTDGGGWVIIQRRTHGDVDFFRDWATYKKGFGTLDTDFWIGNDNIHNLTSQGYTELRINMVLKDGGRHVYAHYSNFSVGDEVSKYKLSVRGFSGTIDDSMARQNGMRFSTSDIDNDIHDSVNCATFYHGTWWYEKCYNSNLNGKWGTIGSKGVVWRTSSELKNLVFTEMKVRYV